MAEKTYKEYLSQVSTRYNNLSDDEKDVVRSMRGTQHGLVLGKILGADMALADLGRKTQETPKLKRRGLGTR